MYWTLEQPNADKNESTIYRSFFFCFIAESYTHNSNEFLISVNVMYSDCVLKNKNKKKLNNTCSFDGINQKMKEIPSIYTKFIERS